MNQNDFTNQLGYFKTNLIALYKQKSKLIAQREALRFQYLTSMKAQFGSVLAAMMQQVYVDQSAGGLKLVGAVMGFIQNRIPMTNMQGQSLQGWEMNPASPGGPHGAGFLSPIEDIISNPFDASQSPKPAYQIYTVAYWEKVGSGSQPVVDFFFIRWDDFYSNSGSVYRSQSWFNGVQDINGDMSNVGKVVTFSLPPSRAWYNAFLATQNIYTTDKNLMLNSSDYASQVLTANYPAGNLVDVLSMMRQAFSDIVNKTIAVIQLQITIDNAQTELGSFVTQYQEFAGTVDMSSLFLDLQTEADKADVPPPPPPVPEPQVLPVNVILVDNSAQEPVLEPVVAQKSSINPWLIGAAVVGTILMARKK